MQCKILSTYCIRFDSLTIAYLGQNMIKTLKTVGCFPNSCKYLVYIYLYSPTVDNTFLCLFCSTCFGDYTTIIRSSCSLCCLSISFAKRIHTQILQRCLNTEVMLNFCSLLKGNCKEWESTETFHILPCKFCIALQLIS